MHLINLAAVVLVRKTVKGGREGGTGKRQEMWEGLHKKPLTAVFIPGASVVREGKHQKATVAKDQQSPPTGNSQVSARILPLWLTAAVHATVTPALPLWLPAAEYAIVFLLCLHSYLKQSMQLCTPVLPLWR